MQFLDLCDDAIYHILDYLDFDSEKELSVTCKKIFQLTSTRICNKGTVTVCFHRIGTELQQLVRSYKSCDVAICSLELRKRRAWNFCLKNSFAYCKFAKFRDGTMNWLDFRMDLKNFQNLTSLTVHAIGLENYHGHFSSPDLKNLEHLTVNFTYNIPSKFFNSCTKLKTLTSHCNSSVFNLNEVLMQQTCLENLTVSSHATNFLSEDFSSNMQFNLKRFFYFEEDLGPTERSRVRENLIKFIERQRNLKTLALNFISGYFLECTYAIRHAECYISMIKFYIEKIELQENLDNSAVEAGQQLNFLYFLEQVRWGPFSEYISFFDSLKRIFPVIKCLSLNNSIADKEESLIPFLNKWRSSIKVLNYMEYTNINLMGPDSRLNEMCTSVHLHFNIDNFDIEKWEEFLESNTQLRKVFLTLRHGGFFEILPPLQKLPNLETLGITKSFDEEDIEWIAQNLKLKVLKLFPAASELISDETKKLFDNTKISNFNLYSLFPDFLRL